MQVLLGSGEAARLLGVSREHVVRLADRGVLPVAILTARGLRLFERREVVRFGKAREAQRAARAVAVK